MSILRRKKNQEGLPALHLNGGNNPSAARYGSSLSCSPIIIIIWSIALLIIGYTIGDRNSSQTKVEIKALTNKLEELTRINIQLSASDVNNSEIQESRLWLDQFTMQWNIPEDIQQERFKECEGRKTASTGGFCLTKQTVIGGNNWVDKPLGNYLRDKLFKDSSVVDLGAGLGHYGKIFTEKGSPVRSWVGYDGAMNVQSATDGLVKYMDLTQPHPADERPCVKGDWVLSLEVAEHIPPQYTDHYLRNIRCSCTVGAVLSWARPSQTGGLGHVNTKHQEDAIKAMNRWGFVVDDEATKEAQAAASMGHFQANTIVYRIKQ